MRVRIVGYIVLCMYNERGRRKSKERQVMGGRPALGFGG